mmetsp:Transcript_58429/g.119500  ORF Transcript_58429/g.119500 Transcript_58429/m.119500 type:complete len:259 (-) Transcript_58429:36-812(-)
MYAGLFTTDPPAGERLAPPAPAPPITPIAAAPPALIPTPRPTILVDPPLEMSSSFIDSSRTQPLMVSTSLAWASNPLMCFCICAFSSLLLRLSTVKSFFRMSLDSCKAGMVRDSLSKVSFMFSSCRTCSLSCATCCCAANRAVRSLLPVSFVRFSSWRMGTMDDSTSAFAFLVSAYISCAFTRFCFRLRLFWSASSKRLVKFPIWLRRFSTSFNFSFIESNAVLSTFTAAIMESNCEKKFPLISTVSSLVIPESMEFE